MRVAFYAPLKAPDHPVPSGDRQMARMLLAALRATGHGAEVASTFRSFLPDPSPDRMRAAEIAAGVEAARIAARWDAEGPPGLWFCYHPYYKAPDLLGPRLLRRFGLRSMAAEASHAGKRAGGPWGPWHAANEATLRETDLHLCFTRRDAEGLARLVPCRRIAMLPPFLAAVPSSPPRQPRRGGRSELVTVAMMRPGDKLRSYAFLAEALFLLPSDPDWRLTVVGDGPEREAVRALFTRVPEGRIAWAGERDAAGVAAALAAADLHVWPGFGEAYGIAYLEAGAAGLPSLAMDCGGISSVVAHDRTGLLTPEGDVAAYARALAGLISDPVLRAALGAAGREMVAGERTVERAAATLSDAIDRLARRD